MVGTTPAHRVQEMMGMPVTVHVADPGVDESVLDQVFADFALLDGVFSPFLAGSAVSRINRGELEEDEAGDLVIQALHMCRLYEQATDGYFSAWLDGRLDPSGLVKGWAIDRGCSILDRHGCRNFFIDAGGDVQTRGLSERGEPWRVGIRHPVQKDKVVRVVLAGGLAVATSGTYEKGDHILDPHTGRTASDLLSFTVVGPDILQADVYATAAFAMGKDRGVAFIDGTVGYEAYSIDRRMKAQRTSGFDVLCEAS
jgi:thiamine biosynthesis lipoprotein